MKLLKNVMKEKRNELIMNKEKEFEEKILNKLLVDLKDIDKYKSFKNGSFIYDLGYYQGNLLVNEIDRLNNIINELEKYLKENIKLTKTAVHFEILDDYDTRKYKRDIALFEMVLDKLKELKENNNV